MDTSKPDEYPPTPTLDAMKEVHDRSQAIGEFLDWLQDEKKAHLATYHEHHDECFNMGRKTRGEFLKDAAELGWRLTRTEEANGRFTAPQCGFYKDQLMTMNYSTEKLLAEFFEIDLDEAENERLAILDYVRKSQPSPA